jgi:hypothetical protein
MIGVAATGYGGVANGGIRGIARIDGWHPGGNTRGTATAIIGAAGNVETIVVTETLHDGNDCGRIPPTIA